jgi:hypothetical protein
MRGIPRWYWLGADLLLAALALIICCKSPSPLTPMRRALAIGALVLGGVMALWALRAGEDN